MNVISAPVACCLACRRSWDADEARELDRLDHEDGFSTLGCPCGETVRVPTELLSEAIYYPVEFWRRLHPQSLRVPLRATVRPASDLRAERRQVWFGLLALLLAALAMLAWFVWGA